MSSTKFTEDQAINELARLRETQGAHAQFSMQHLGNGYYTIKADMWPGKEDRQELLKKKSVGIELEFNS